MIENKFKTSLFHKIIFTISLFVLLFIGAITFRHINNISDSSQLVVHTYEVNLELERLFSNIKDSENSMRGFLISNDTLYLIPYRNATIKVNISFEKLQELTKDNALQQKNLTELFQIINKRYEFMSHYSVKERDDVKRNKNFKDNFRESSRLLVDIRKKLNAMVDIENSYLTARNLNYDKQIYLTPILTLSILFIALLLIILAYYQITKDVEKLQAVNLRLSKSQFLSYQAEILSEFGTWEWNLSTNEITYSDNFYRILGYEPQSFPSNNDVFLNFVHPEDKEKALAIMDEVVKNQSLSHSTYRIIRPDGEVRHFRASGKLFIDKLNNKIVLGVTEDITKDFNKNELLKSNNNELIKINKELNIFDESSRQAEILGNYGSWILNYETLQFTYSDNKFRLLGHEPQSFNPSIEKLLEFVHPDDRQVVIEANKKALALGQIPTMNYRIIRKDGQERYFKTIAKLFTDASGKNTMIGTTQDVTEEFQNSLELQKRNKELERNIRELSEFNHVASHDLQEPLRKIQTFISRVNEKEAANLSNFGKEYLARTEKAANRMRVLINDLLQYSRTSLAEKKFEEVNLNEAFQNSLSELSQNIEDKKAVIIPSDLPTIKGILFQMQQLFSNLLSNALKYSKEDVAPVISITAEKITAIDEPLLNDHSKRHFYKISLTDNGIGFEEEHSEKIFLLFNRLHGKTDYQGTGVGLAICKKIVENHNGFIFAKSQPNKGTTFLIFLPD